MSDDDDDDDDDDDESNTVIINNETVSNKHGKLQFTVRVTTCTNILTKHTCRHFPRSWTIFSPHFKVANKRDQSRSSVSIG